MEISYRATALALRTSSTIRYSPIKGIINSCILYFPSGCEGLAEVFLNIRTRQILPYPAKGTGGTNTGIALDNTTQPFSIDEAVDKNDPIELLIVNHDSVKSHTITAVLKILTKQTYTGP